MAITNAKRERDQPAQIEWATLGLIALCYIGWILTLFAMPTIVAIPALIFCLVLHASLTHEVCHGHPLPSRQMSELLMHFNPGLAVPYLRFRDTHLAHHRDSMLTDPYDDPESNYLDPAKWENMPRGLKILCRINNTLAGRMLVGPALGQVSFMMQDWRAIRYGDGQVLRGWLVHLPGFFITLWLVSLSDISFWVYVLCAYLALSVLKIRTFLEHRAHEKSRGRTVIIEDRGILAFLFLNNNFHVVHHMHPSVPWHRLPALYLENKARYLGVNEGYVYRSYRDIFAQHFLTAKDPVPHPLWPKPPQ